MNSLTVSPVASNQPVVDDARKWHDLQTFGIEGRGFDAVSTPYDRLPSKAKNWVRSEVWDLSTCSSGLCARFVTDATNLTVRWSLRHEELATPRMSATGMSGLDLYVKVDGAWQWQASAQPRQVSGNEQVLIETMTPERREFLLYLPLFNGVKSVHVAIPASATLQPAPPYSPSNAKPICFYGTSIVQGDCASRPGMAYPSILSRMLHRPTLNLGFAGQGRAEPELAELLSEIDAAVYVLDPLPNLVPEIVEERMTTFVRTLTRSHPRTPIVLVESIAYQESILSPERLERFTGSNRAVQRVFRDLQSDGVPNLHYVCGADLLGNDGEATVDGTHPTDLGFHRISQTLLPSLNALLEPLSVVRDL